MIPKKIVRQSVVLLLLLLCSAVMARHSIGVKPRMWDFYVYDEAAMLLHDGNGSKLYEGADTGVDPQMRWSAPDSLLTQAAARCGLSTTSFYLYPPLLADLVYPFASVAPATAARIWYYLNVGALGLVAFLLLKLLSLRIASLGALAVVVGLLTMDSTLFSLEGGQITIMLLLLWTVGIYLQSKGRSAGSAFCFALAAAIKLTPLLVVAPFLIWRDWRWLRAFAVSFAGLIAVMCVVNSPAVVANYVLHVMPAVGAGVPAFENKSLISTIELTYMTLHGAGADAWGMVVPARLASVAKIVAAIPVAAAICLLYRAGSKLNLAGRVYALALMALLSACISPVSWRHAYVVACIALVLLWAKAFREGISNVKLVLLAVCTFEICTFHLDYVLFGFSAAHPAFAGVATVFAPLSGLALVLTEFFEMALTDSVYTQASVD